MGLATESEIFRQIWRRFRYSKTLQRHRTIITHTRMQLEWHICVGMHMPCFNCTVHNLSTVEQYALFICYKNIFVIARYFSILVIFLDRPFMPKRNYINTCVMILFRNGEHRICSAVKGTDDGHRRGSFSREWLARWIEPALCKVFCTVTQSRYIYIYTYIYIHTQTHMQARTHERLHTRAHVHVNNPRYVNMHKPCFNCIIQH